MMDRLAALLDTMSPVAIAVSGGVDSMTLATLAGRRPGGGATMFHAVSPAVPDEATARVKNRAEREGWALTVFDAGEFADPAYRANPANRCFYCKTSLYAAVAERTEAQIVSGTNLDDLADWRPGLQAADDHGVRHPFVEAGIDKSAVRDLARALGLGEIAELPAAPCLSSRVETGLRIEPDALKLIHAVESYVRRQLQTTTVRCRMRREAVVIELDDAALGAVRSSDDRGIVETIAGMVRREGDDRPIRLAPYERGSAFLRGASTSA